MSAAIAGTGRSNSLVTAVLSAAEEQGAETEKIYLIDKHVEFCTNCWTCTQNPGARRGECLHQDEMAGILDRYDASDGMVFGAPVNCFNLNAITRRFMERLVCLTYWPWGTGGYVRRKKSPDKRAVLITSSAMPAIMGRFFTGVPRALRVIADTMGAKPVASLFAGLKTAYGRSGQHAPQGTRGRTQAGGRALNLLQA